VFCVSMSGVSPLTVIVSSRAPTCRSALTAAVNPAVSWMPSRFTALKPGSENVTTYVPGRRLTMLNRPCASVTAVRTFSMSAGLAASTVTPGSKAPELSRTSPAMPLACCAHAGAASSVHSITTTCRGGLVLRVISGSP
jgi:hypothetical protein